MLSGMTSHLDSADVSVGDRDRSRAYHRDFWPSMVAYGIVLATVITFGDLDGTSPWRFVWALLPVLPTLWTVRAVVRHVRRIDDYQRMLLLQSLAVGFALAMVASLTVAFLEIAGLRLPAGGWVVYGVGMGGWAVASRVLGNGAGCQ